MTDKDYFSVKAIWPDDKAEEARNIPGLKELVSERISYTDFQKEGKKVLKWSESQEPQPGGCRFSAWFLDKTGNSKEHYKEQDKMVQGIFYKGNRPQYLWSYAEFQRCNPEKMLPENEVKCRELTERYGALK